LLALANSLIGRVDVLDANIQSFGITSTTAFVTSDLTFASSKTASITKSASERFV
jgi:hypothetical protein